MTQASPPGWGNDPLTSYFEAHRANQFATFANKNGAVADLIKIDGMFYRLLNGAINPRPYYPMGFLLRAHSAFRAAVAITLSGQLYEAQALLRLCLEHTAYGFYIGADCERMARWLSRGESEANRKAVRKEFHNDKLRAHLEAQAPVMCGHFDRLYNQLIEFGAHPNELGYSANTNMTEQDGDVRLQTVYLQGDGLQLDLGLKVAGQVGLWALHLMQLIYKERYELLGIRADLEDVRKRF